MFHFFTQYLNKNKRYSTASSWNGSGRKCPMRKPCPPASGKGRLAQVIGYMSDEKWLDCNSTSKLEAVRCVDVGWEPGRTVEESCPGFWSE